MIMGKIVPSEIARLIAAQRRVGPVKCVICGLEVVGTVRRRYCSTRCAQKAAYYRHLEERRVKRRERYRQQKEQPQA